MHFPKRRNGWNLLEHRLHNDRRSRQLQLLESLINRLHDHALLFADHVKRGADFLLKRKDKRSFPHLHGGLIFFRLAKQNQALVELLDKLIRLDIGACGKSIGHRHHLRAG